MKSTFLLRYLSIICKCGQHINTPTCTIHILPRMKKLNKYLPTNPNINTIRLRQFYRQLLLNLQGTQKLCLIQTVPENNKIKNSPKLIL